MSAGSCGDTASLACVGRIRHPDFAMASGEMSGEQFTTFLSTAFSHVAAHSADGALSFVFMDWRHLREILDAGQSSFSELKNLVVWNKDNGGMGSLYRSKHELIFVFKSGTGAPINNVELGRHGRNRDRDRAYGDALTRRIRAMGIRDRPTAPRSPWQNGYAERLIGSIRRECLDHVIVFGERHLRHVLRSYAEYYNGARTHLSLTKDSPFTRSVQRVGSILPQSVLGGLHHHYVRI